MSSKNNKSGLINGSALRFILLFFLFFIVGKADALTQNNQPEITSLSTGDYAAETQILMLTLYAKIHQDSIYLKVDQEAEFRGGANKWTRHFQETVAQNIRDFEFADYGECRVKFVVDVNGKVSNISFLTMKETRLAEAVETAIRRGGKWEPAMFDGKKVKAYKELTVTMRNPR